MIGVKVPINIYLMDFTMTLHTIELIPGCSLDLWCLLQLYGSELLTCAADFHSRTADRKNLFNILHDNLLQYFCVSLLRWRCMMMQKHWNMVEQGPGAPPTSKVLQLPVSEIVMWLASWIDGLRPIALSIYHFSPSHELTKNSAMFRKLSSERLNFVE